MKRKERILERNKTAVSVSSCAVKGEISSEKHPQIAAHTTNKTALVQQKKQHFLISRANGNMFVEEPFYVSSSSAPAKKHGGLLAAGTSGSTVRDISNRAPPCNIATTGRVMIHLVSDATARDEDQ